MFRWAAPIPIPIRGAVEDKPVLSGIPAVLADPREASFVLPNLRLVLYGGGAARRPDPHELREFNAIIELARLGWGKDNPAFRQVFTSRFVPGATDEQLSWFNELCRRTSTPEIVSRLLETRSRIDVSARLAQVQVPTLVLHPNRDGLVPFAEGRLLASGIPGAQFVELDSRNHILLETEPAWQRFCQAVLEFVGMDAASGAEDPAFASLSPREREILALRRRRNRRVVSEFTMGIPKTHVPDKCRASQVIDDVVPGEGTCVARARAGGRAMNFVISS